MGKRKEYNNSEDIFNTNSLKIDEKGSMHYNYRYKDNKKLSLSGEDVKEGTFNLKNIKSVLLLSPSYAYKKITHSNPKNIYKAPHCGVSFELDYTINPNHYLNVVKTLPLEAFELYCKWQGVTVDEWLYEYENGYSGDIEVKGNKLYFDTILHSIDDGKLIKYKGSIDLTKVEDIYCSKKFTEYERDKFFEYSNFIFSKKENISTIDKIKSYCIFKVNGEFYILPEISNNLYKEWKLTSFKDKLNEYNDQEESK